jgi:hypothetical protein
MLLEIYNDIFEKSPRIEKVILVKNANIVEIGAKLFEEGFEVRSWSAGTDRIESYKKMADKYHDQAKLADDFEMIEIKRNDEDISATKARQALLDNNVKEFAKLTPLMTIKTRAKGNQSFETLRSQLLKVLDK